MDHRLPGGDVRAVRVTSSLRLATFFTAASSSSRRGERHGRAGPPPALMADVRVVIRRHFPACGPDGNRIVVKKIAEDISLRRRPSRQLRQPENVDRALAKDVLPLVRHRYDRGAVVAAGTEICTHVAAACADPRIAHGGAHVLVLIDTFACPVVFACAPPKSLIVKSSNSNPCMDFESWAPAEKLKPVGVIGDKRPKSVGVIGDNRPKPVGVIGDKRPKPVGVIGDKRPKPAEEERFKGWLPW